MVMGVCQHSLTTFSSWELNPETGDTCGEKSDLRSSSLMQWVQGSEAWAGDRLCYASGLMVGKWGCPRDSQQCLETFW